MPANIEHVIVLMLENRSFDHMLGFLDHPDPGFPGIRAGDHANRNPAGGSVGVSSKAEFRLAVGPDHSHEGIEVQLEEQNHGFVRNYHQRLTKRRQKLEQKLARAKKRLARDKAVVRSFRRGSALHSPARKAMLRARVRYQRKKVAELSKALKATRPDRDAGKVMACFAQERLPVLSMLAKEFCVFTKWHASVPGETWPNRSFAHAATSDGEVNIKIRFYTNPTIFEALAAAFKKTRSKAEQKRAWAVYHDGPAQVWAYRKLWGQKGNNFRKLKHLVGEIADPNNAKNPLPRYSFVEPNHGLKLGPLFKKRSERSNNQHPNNNTAGIRDFLAAEELIASIYNALRANPNLFKKTLFLITYDEHGGFFDHEIPAKTHAPIRGGAVNPDHGFDFKSLGVRVPAVLVSPWIDQGTINQEVRDHAAIPRTIREVFIGDKNYLTRREAWAEPFHGLLNRTSPRAAGSMPPARPMGIAHACALEGISTKHFKKLEKFEDKTATLIKRELDDLDKSLVNLTANVERELDRLAAGDTSHEAIGWDDDAGAALHDAMPSDHDLAYRLDEVTARLQGEDN